MASTEFQTVVSRNNAKIAQAREQLVDKNASIPGILRGTVNAAFECYITWRMTGKIRIVAQGVPKRSAMAMSNFFNDALTKYDHRPVNCVYDLLAHAYILAQDVPDLNFANALVDSFVATAKQHRHLPDLDVVTDVHVHTIHSVFASGRHLITVLYLCRARNKAERKNLLRNFPADMLVRDDVRDAFDRLQPAGHQALIDRVRAQDFYDQESQ